MQRSIFYVGGKESQKDILRLRQLEQAMHENGSTSSDQAQSSINETAKTPANGYQSI